MMRTSKFNGQITEETVARVFGGWTEERNKK